MDATCWGRVQRARDVLDVRLGTGGCRKGMQAPCRDDDEGRTGVERFKNEIRSTGKGQQVRKVWGMLGRGLPHRIASTCE